jgi:hypothetical protein
MPTNPRSRRSRRASNSDPSLPIIPILIGVIVLGFVIGAGLSLAGRHDTTVVALSSPSPAAAVATFQPVTPAPAEKPTAEPTDEPARAPLDFETAAAATATEMPSQPAAPAPAKVAAAPQVAASPQAATGAQAASAVPAAASPRIVAPVPESAAPLAPPAAVVRATAAPSHFAAAAATPEAQTPPAPSPAASNGADADEAFAKLSAAVVRQYLEAVKRGDQDDAYAALGASPGDRGASLTEAGIVDSQTRVGRIDAHPAANHDALVSVQLETPSGPYFGQFTVHKIDTGAAVIVAHSIVKP